MVQVNNQTPATPKIAAKQKGALDKALDVELFKALGDSTRAKLLACLAKCARPCSTSEVAECCNVDFSVVTRHLKVLENAGVIEASKVGRTVSYSVRSGEVSTSLKNLADAFQACCNPDAKGGCC